MTTHQTLSKMRFIKVKRQKLAIGLAILMRKQLEQVNQLMIQLYPKLIQNEHDSHAVLSGHPCPSYQQFYLPLGMWALLIPKVSYMISLETNTYQSMTWLLMSLTSMCGWTLVRYPAKVTGEDRSSYGIKRQQMLMLSIGITTTVSFVIIAIVMWLWLLRI